MLRKASVSALLVGVVGICLSGCVAFLLPSPTRECKRWFTNDFMDKTEAAKHIVRQATSEELFHFYLCKSRQARYDSLFLSYGLTWQVKRMSALSPISSKYSAV